VNTPITKRTYFAVADLDVDGFDVVILLPSGAELVARRKRIARRGQVTQTVWRARVERREPGRPLRYDYRDLPEHLEITRWRPLDKAKFPGLLPSTPARIEGDVRWQSPAEPAAAPEPTDDELEWAGPYNEPPNISPREAHIRIVRAWKTDRSLREIKGQGGPRGFVDSLAITTMAALGEIPHEHVDASYVGPVGAAWQPSRRDISDYLVGMGWFTRLSKAERELLVLRAIDPPHSFRSIAARWNKSGEAVRKAYAKLLVKVAKVANTATEAAGGCTKWERKSMDDHAIVIRK
jgi:hypothetical protein